MMNQRMYIRRKGIVTGPFTPAQLNAMVARGGIAATDEVSTDRTAWVPASRRLAGTVGDNVETMPLQPNLKRIPDAPAQDGASVHPAAQQNAPSQPPALSQPDARPDALAQTEEMPSGVTAMICSFAQLDKYADFLAERPAGVIAGTSLYALLALAIPLACFSSANGGSMSSSLALNIFLGVLFFLLSMGASYLAAVICRRHSSSYRQEYGMVFAMVLLMQAATAFGTALALFHGLRHAFPFVRMLIMAFFLMLHVGFVLSTAKAFHDMVRDTFKLPVKIWLPLFLGWHFLHIAVFCFITVFHLRFL